MTPDPDLPENIARWSMIDSKAKEQRLADLFRFLNENSIDAVVIKGWAVGRFYPQNHPRAYTDIDIAVAPADFDRIYKLLRDGPAKYHADLHQGLRNLHLTDWENVFDRSCVLHLQGVGVRVLNEEDNLTVTAVHWLIDGGINRDRLYDIYYLVQNRRPDFDWEMCLAGNGEIRRTWIISTIRAAVEYLGLDDSELPNEIRSASLPDWFRQTLKREWALGVYPRVPLYLCIGRPKVLFEQLRRRFPPNKIAATIEMEQPIDNHGRTFTQFRSTGRRAAAFLRKIKSVRTPLS